MVMISREQKLGHARDVLRRAGPAGALVLETSPSNDANALRARDIERLVDMGEAEWIDATRARLLEKAR